GEVALGTELALVGELLQREAGLLAEFADAPSDAEGEGIGGLPARHGLTLRRQPPTIVRQDEPWRGGRWISRRGRGSSCGSPKRHGGCVGRRSGYCGARAPRRRWRRRARRRGRSARWTKRCSSSRTSIRSRDRRSPAEAGAPSRFEARGEAETGEEPIGVEEEGQALDAIAALDG